jgi:NADH dehydrogenase
MGMADSISASKRPRVAIVGAGFGGLWAARTLANTDLNVVVVDRNNYHTFLPLLYQVAAAELQPEQIAYPVRAIFRQTPNVDFIMAEVQGIDFAGRRLRTQRFDISYDYLILAMGSVTAFFGVPGAEEHAFRLKTLEQGIALRNHIMQCFEQAAFEPDPVRRQRLLTFAVVGGGLTGLEYSGALAELIRGPIRKDFRVGRVEEAKVVLIEAQKSLLAGFPDKLRRYARDRLRRRGVEVRLNTQVTGVRSDRLLFIDGTVLPTETVLWTAGVCGHPAYAAWGLPVSPHGRIRIEPTLQLRERPEVFVAGDLSFIEEGKPLPLIAPVAKQQGKQAAENILALAAGNKPKPFVYRDKGAMATIGRGAAVVRLGKYSFCGGFAWLLWLVIHLLYLIGFRNRLIVLIHWSFNYFLFERAVRLILPKEISWIRKAQETDR